MHLRPDGRFLYASERTSSSLSAYAVDGVTGKLTRLASIATATQPRGFNIDPRGRFLLSVGQKSRLTTYAIDGDSGALKPLFLYTLGRNPNWGEIIDLP